MSGALEDRAPWGRRGQALLWNLGVRSLQPRGAEPTAEAVGGPCQLGLGGEAGPGFRLPGRARPVAPGDFREPRAPGLWGGAQTAAALSWGWRLGSGLSLRGPGLGQAPLPGHMPRWRAQPSTPICGSQGQARPGAGSSPPTPAPWHPAPSTLAPGHSGARGRLFSPRASKSTAWFGFAAALAPASI